MILNHIKYVQFFVCLQLKSVVGYNGKYEIYYYGNMKRNHDLKCTGYPIAYAA